MADRTYSYEFKLLDKVTAPVNKITGAFRNATKPVDKLKSKISSIKKPIASVGKSVDKLKRTILGFLAVDQLRGFGTEMVSTLAKFERMEAVLTNTLGSNSAAKTVLKDIEGFASRTPFQVDGLTGAWVKLANQGFKPNMKQMTMLGDLASSTGKDFDQLAEAVIDAQVGEFERLKEFGIRSEKSGNKVAFTFKGVKKEVDFTEKSIQEYLLSLGKLQGVQGSMNAISKTTGGMLSNLTDKWTSYKKLLGESLKPTIVSIISLFSSTIDRLKNATIWIQNNAGSFKAWGSEVLKNLKEVSAWIHRNSDQLKFLTLVTIQVGAAMFGVWTAVTVFAKTRAIVYGIVKVWQLYRKGLLLTTAMQVAFNFVASLNPMTWIFIAGAAIVGLAYKFEGVRKFLGTMGEWLWKNNPFNWLLDLVEYLMPSVGKSVRSFFTKTWDFIHSTFIEPIQRFISWLRGDEGEGIEIKGGVSLADTQNASASEETLGYRSAMDEYAADYKKKKSIDPYSATNFDGSPTFEELNKGKNKQESKNPIKDGLSSVTGGGGNIKHINIKIDKLVETLTISTSTIGMAKEQLKAEIGRILLSVVNDVNYQ